MRSTSSRAEPPALRPLLEHHVPLAGDRLELLHPRLAVRLDHVSPQPLAALPNTANVVLAACTSRPMYLCIGAPCAAALRCNPRLASTKAGRQPFRRLAVMSSLGSTSPSPPAWSTCPELEPPAERPSAVARVSRVAPCSLVSGPPQAPAQRGEAPGHERARCHCPQATAEMRRRHRWDRCGRHLRGSAGTRLRTPRFQHAYPPGGVTAAGAWRRRSKRTSRATAHIHAMNDAIYPLSIGKMSPPALRPSRRAHQSRHRHEEETWRTMKRRILPRRSG